MTDVSVFLCNGSSIHRQRPWTLYIFLSLQNNICISVSSETSLLEITNIYFFALQRNVHQNERWSMKSESAAGVCTWDAVWAFPFSSLLLALSIETQNDTYEFAVHILLLSSRANDCNQSDFLCSGRAKKLHSERCSHVISVMWSAMTDSWMACLCGRHRMLIFNDSFFHKKSQL